MKWVDKQEALAKYITLRKLKNHSDTIYDIENHIRWFLDSTTKPLDKFNEDILLDYVSKISPKYKTTMLNNIKSSYLKPFIKRTFQDWSSRFPNLDEILKVETAQETYEAEDMISEEDFKKLIQKEESRFWKAYFLTQFYGACRPIEVCNLKWENVEFNEDGAFITIFSKKNKKSFIKFLPHDVAYYLKELKAKNSESEYVFYNERTGKQITKKGAYWKIKQLSKEALGKPIDLYTLRHSIATILYNKEDMKDDDIAKQMGHTKSMKGKYVHNSKDKLKEIAKKIYVKAEELPPEKKHELEMQIAQMKQGETVLQDRVALLEKALRDFIDGKLGKNENINRPAGY